MLENMKMLKCAPCLCDEGRSDSFEDDTDNTQPMNTAVDGDYRKGEVLFYTQIVLLTVVILTSLVHLSVQHGNQTF